MRILFFSLFLITNLVAQSNSSNEIAAFWVEASRTVMEGDFEAYANSFHEEGILVNGISGNSMPIKVALDGWKEGFDNTKAGEMRASVQFRFSASAIGATTAHQTGIFLYKWQNEGEEAQEVYIHFEALLTKSTSEWKLLMEYQKSTATKEEWHELE